MKEYGLSNNDINKENKMDKKLEARIARLEKLLNSKNESTIDHFRSELYPIYEQIEVLRKTISNIKDMIVKENNKSGDLDELISGLQRIEKNTEYMSDTVFSLMQTQNDKEWSALLKKGYIR